MSTHQHHGVKGRMDLLYDFKESSSGHVDTTTHRFLQECDVDGEVELVLEFDHSNHYKFADSSRSKNVYRIAAADLIALIEANGRKIF